MNRVLRRAFRRAAFTSRDIAFVLGREALAMAFHAVRFSLGLVVGFTLGLAAIQVFWSEFLSIAAGISKLIIFLLRIFLAFVL